MCNTSLWYNVLTVNEDRINEELKMAMRTIVKYKSMTLQTKGEVRITAMAWRWSDGSVSWDINATLPQDVISVHGCYFGGEPMLYTETNKGGVREAQAKLLEQADEAIAKAAQYR